MDERELTALIEAERPAPEAVFVAELDERVRQGFPRERRRLVALPKIGRPPMAVMGAAASLLLALVVAVALTGGDEPRNDALAPSQAPETAPIQRSATLALAAPADRLDRVAADVAKLTERYRGFVLSSTLATGDEGVTTGGSFELRIPAARLQPALADLAKLGQVRARTQSGEDVTAAFVTAGDRLQAARAERRSLLTRLEQAETDVEAESLRLQLDANAGEINRFRAQLRRLRVTTDYATVSMTLEGRDGEAPAPGDGIGGALDDAIDSLGDSLELAIRALGVLLPPALLAAALIVGGRAILRRRRESALS